MTMQTGGLPGAYQAVDYIQRDVEGAIILIPFDTLNVANCDIYATFTIIGPALGERAYMGASSGLGKSAWEIYFPYVVWAVSNNGISTDGTIATIGTQGSVHVKMDDRDRILTLGQYRYGAYQSENRIHYCRVERSGDVVLELLPCVRKSDSKPGMYDTVSKTFYTNAGSGEFIVPA